MSSKHFDVLEFVRSTRLEQRLRLVPSEGYSADDILKLLEDDRVDVVGDSLLLRKAPGTCCAEQVVLGQVLINERLSHQKPWRKPGMKKKRRLGKQGQMKGLVVHEPVAQKSEQQQTPAKSCCQLGRPEHLIFQAGQLRWNAERQLQGPLPDTAAAASAIKAARSLLEAADALDSVEAVWLIAAEGLLLDKLGKYKEASSRFCMASSQSAADLGCDHPTTVVLLGNRAQYDIEHGQESAKEELASVIERLSSGRVTEDGTCSDEWLAAARTEFSATLARADELIAAFKQKQPQPITAAMATGILEQAFVVDWSCVNKQPSQLLSRHDENEPAIALEVGEQKIRQRQPGSLWFEKNATTLPEQEWCAADGTGLIAHHKDYEGLMRKLNELKVPTQDLTVMFSKTRESSTAH